MERYINADKLIKKIFPLGLVDDGKYTINAKAVKMAIDKAPTADVVLKSEVDKLIAEAKQEVAREIFEEILKTAYYPYGKNGDTIVVYPERIAELKKKYTESEDTK